VWAEVGEVGEVQNLGHGGDPGVRRHSEELSKHIKCSPSKRKNKGKNSTKLVKGGWKRIKTNTTLITCT